MVIERENKEIENHKPIQEWEPEDMEFYAEVIEERQNQLCELQLIHALGNLLSQKEILNYKDIQHEVIVLCIGLLKGGNKVA